MIHLNRGLSYEYRYPAFKIPQRKTPVEAKFFLTETLSGDSGSGMVLKVNGLWKIVGIVSAAVAKPVIFEQGETKVICDLDNYLVYTDVAKFYNWINQVILETGGYPDILQST
jgi:secreted trypsin-like serine protease